MIIYYAIKYVSSIIFIAYIINHSRQNIPPMIYGESKGLGYDQDLGLG